MTSKGQSRDPCTLRAQYLENSWRCYLATIANAHYYIVCCDAVQSAILATAWLLVKICSNSYSRSVYYPQTGIVINNFESLRF